MFGEPHLHFGGALIQINKVKIIQSTPALVCSLWEAKKLAQGHITFIRDALHALLVCKEQTERRIMLRLLF